MTLIGRLLAKFQFLEKVSDADNESGQNEFSSNKEFELFTAIFAVKL